MQVGTTADEAIALPVNDIMTRELSIHGTFRYADEFYEAIRLATSGRLDFGPLITDVFSLAEIDRALECACSGNGTLKVQLAVSSG